MADQFKTESEKVVRSVINAINTMDMFSAYDASNRKPPTNDKKQSIKNIDRWSCQCGEINGSSYKDNICDKCGTIVKKIDPKYGYIIDVDSFVIKEGEE